MRALTLSDFERTGRAVVLPSTGSAIPSGVAFTQYSVVLPQAPLIASHLGDMPAADLFVYSVQPSVFDESEASRLEILRVIKCVEDRLEEKTAVGTQGMATVPSAAAEQLPQAWWLATELVDKERCAFTAVYQGVLLVAVRALTKALATAIGLESNSTSGGSAGAKLSVPDTLNPLRKAAGAIASQGIASALAHAVGEDPEAEMSLRQSDLDRASRGQLIDAMRHAQV